MKHCPRCQRTLAEEAKFCMYCGATVEETPAEPIKRFCTNCGKEVVGNFCIHCGMPVGGAAQVAEKVSVSAPKKKGKGGLIAAMIAIVLVLGLALSWAFGLFGDGGLFGEDGIFAGESHRDRDRDDEDEVEKKQIPIVAKHPTLGEVVEGYMEVDITDERDCVYRWEDGTIHDAPEEPQIQPVQPEKIALTVWAPAEEHDYLTKMADSFADAHPEYEITFRFETVHAGDAQYYMLSDVEAGADIYMFANDQLGGLVEADALAPITGTVLEQVKSGTAQTMLDSVTYGGDVYGIPYTGNTWWLYYDKSVFSSEDIKSLETMLEKGKVAFRLDNGWYFPAFYFANGCTMFGPNGNNAAAGFDFGGENAVAVTNYLVDLVKNPNFVCDDGYNGLAGIQDGSIKAFVSGEWEAYLVKEALGENFGAAQLPTITIGGEAKQMSAFAGSKAIGVNPHSDNLIVSYLFAMYLGSAEGQLLRYEMCGVIPCNTHLADRIANEPVALAMMNSLNNTATVQPFVPEMSIWWNHAANFAHEIISGSVTHKNAEAKTKEFNEILNNG